MDVDHDQAISQFVSLTGLSRASATEILEENDWDIDMAIAQHFDGADGMDTGDANSEHGMTHAPSYSGPPEGRRLGDTSTPSHPVASTAPTIASSSSTKSRTKVKRGGIASLRDLQQQGDSNENDDDSDKDQEYFAGGDKSGLAVQDRGSGHNQHIQRLLDRARRNGPPPSNEETPQSAFSGQGQTLGGDDTPSRIIPDPSAEAPRGAPMVERILHIWDDGFSIDDGPLHRYDDPANRRTLEMINRGSAPLELMNVEPGQAVDVRLDQHRGEKYVAPKKKYTAFSGGGQRLGSPVPGISSSVVAPHVPATSSTPASSPALAAEIDEAQPTIALRVTLADGTRMPSRFNTTHTIGDVYDFVDRASVQSPQRAYTLATTFPTKEFTDKSQVLGDIQEFKRGGAIVQKWQ